MRSNIACIAACAALLGCSHIPDPADVPSTRHLKWVSQVFTIVTSGIVIQNRDDS